jgi:hypothetical protein
MLLHGFTDLAKLSVHARKFTFKLNEKFLPSKILVVEVGSSCRQGLQYNARRGASTSQLLHAEQTALLIKIL